MNILEISSRKFREHQKEYFDLADNGTQIVIKRGVKTYVITPLNEDDLYLTPEVKERIEVSLKQAKEGKVTKVKTKEELNHLLESL